MNQTKRSFIKNRTIFTEKGKYLFSNKVNLLMKNENWKVLQNELKKKLKYIPNDHWLLTTLANCLYEQKKYKSALKYSQKALKIASDDPLVIYDYAPILRMTGDIKGAIKYWKKIEEMNLQELSHGKYGEGIRWAKSIKNNVFYHLAFAYKDLNDKKNFKKYLQKNIKQREKGLFCNYTKKEALKIYNSYFGFVFI